MMEDRRADERVMGADFDGGPGWCDVEGDVVAVPGWDTHWFRNDEDSSCFGVVAKSVKRYPKGRYVLRQLVTKEFIEDPGLIPVSVGEYLAQWWNSCAEGAA